MGVNDAAEQLQAAIAECVRLEREVAARDAVLADIRVIMEKPGHPNDFYIHGFHDQYEALAELYNDEFAFDLACAVNAAPESSLSRVIAEAKAEALEERTGVWLRRFAADVNDRGERARALDSILSPLLGRDATVEEVAKFVRWADGYQYAVVEAFDTIWLAACAAEYRMAAGK